MLYLTAESACAVQPNVLRPTAAKAEALLGEVLAADPDNPLALHLHIHITEASAPSRSVLPCLRCPHAEGQVLHESIC